VGYEAIMRGEMTAPLVGIIDDDESVRDSLGSLMRSAGYRTAVFRSADALLNSDHIGNGSRMILLLDIHMPGLSGLELQHRLADLKLSIPIIFVTADQDDAVRARALQQGAFAFFAKPFKDNALLSTIRAALE